MEATFRWIKHCFTTNRYAHVEPSTVTIGLEWLGPVWTSTYKLCRYILNEKDSNLSVYGTMLCGLVCINLIIMTVRLVEEHVRTRDICLMELSCLETVLCMIAFTFNIDGPDKNAEIIVILVAQCINSLFYFRLFHINGYFQCVLLSYFLYIELQRASYFVILPILYVLSLIISLQKHLSAIISHLKDPDLELNHWDQYKKTLESCFFYAVFNLLLSGIESDPVQVTAVVIFCTSFTVYSRDIMYFMDRYSGGITNKLTGTPMAAYLSKGLKPAEGK